MTKDWDYPKAPLKIKPQTLWEILVPTQTNDGKPIRTRQHREWDKRVRKFSDGLTIMKPAIGEWKSYRERMIPVRILVDADSMMKIVDMTAAFYNQEDVLAYEIATTFIRYKYVAKN